MAGGNRRDADQAIAAALAAGATKQEAARLVGVGERTVYRRLEDRQFRRRIDDARADLVNRVAGGLADASLAAVDTLRALLEADSESVRLGACRAILDLCLRHREADEFERRIAAIEERAMAEASWRKAG